MCSLFVVSAGRFNILAYVPAGVRGASISRNYVYQAKSNWCWAAVAENAIIAEGGKVYTQWDAVRVLIGSSSDNYPNLPQNMIYTEEAAEYISGYAYDFVCSGVLSYSFMADKIYNGHPIITGAGYYVRGVRQGGHCVLIYGWNNSTGVQNVTYYDSDYTGNSYTCSYSDFCNGTFNGRIYDQSCYRD